MKKVIVVFTSTDFSQPVAEFAIAMAREHTWLLQCIFLNDLPSDIAYPFPNDYALTETEITRVSEEKENVKLVADHSRVFRDYCKNAGVTCEEEKTIEPRQLAEYTAVADLMIVDARIRLYHSSLTDILTDAPCPVCLVSEAAAEVKHIILTYDGSDSARYAIERFIQIFPRLNYLPVELVSINPNLEVLEHKEFINQILPDHFPLFNLQLLQGNEREVLDHFVQQYPEGALVVMGAFGRSALSRFFRPSLAKEILRETTATVFIAHE